VSLLLKVIRIAGWIFGAAVIVYGLNRYFQDSNLPALLIAIAVVIVGPLEDFLKKRMRKKAGVREEPAVELVDLTTSLAFLILLVFAIFLGR
jgi:predicted PurR-regulated permease PerM